MSTMRPSWFPNDDEWVWDKYFPMSAEELTELEATLVESITPEDICEEKRQLEELMKSKHWPVGNPFHFLTRFRDVTSAARERDFKPLARMMRDHPEQLQQMNKSERNLIADVLKGKKRKWDRRYKTQEEKQTPARAAAHLVPYVEQFLRTNYRPEDYANIDLENLAIEICAVKTGLGLGYGELTITNLLLRDP